MELAISRYFGTRENFIIPNVFWGLGFRYELDLLIVKSSNYAYEVEIKRSLADLKADKKKNIFAHNSNRIRKLFFAVPLELKEQALELIPDKAGLLIVDEFLRVYLAKFPKINKNAIKLTEKERLKLGDLCSMRIWNLKEILNKK